MSVTEVNIKLQEKKQLSLIQFFIQEYTKKLIASDAISARYEVLTAVLLMMKYHQGRDAVWGEEIPTFQNIVVRSPSYSRQRFTIFRKVVNCSVEDIA